MAAGAENVANELIDRLEQAWNEADGRAFGEPFTADADFSDIRGEYHSGQEAIATGHQAIFDSIYKGGQQHPIQADTGQRAFGRCDPSPCHRGSSSPIGPSGR
jgi:uncharacterized protein (TIGR02246 family)